MNASLVTLAESDHKTAPFLRWAGGKRQLIPILMKHLPPDVKGRRYVEPFLGAGSLYFSLEPLTALLSDANPFLISTYEQVRDNAAQVRKHLVEHTRLHNKAHYYATRSQYNKLRHSAAQAARFIYLNMACFNGIFRVNTKGQFNVPKGSKTKLPTPSKKHLDAISELLGGATLLTADFAETIKLVKSNDFVYLDPPYPALNGTAYFTHYTADRFDTNNQKRLAEAVLQMHNSGCRFLMTNADVPAIRDLYRTFNQVEIPVMRFVSCKGTRQAARELIITNYL